MTKLQNELPKETEAGIDSFRCSKDNDLTEFLQTHAALFEKNDKSRTYAFLDECELRARRIRIAAYFSVAMQVMYVPSHLSVRQIQRLDGFSGKIHGRKIEALPVFLIGQLARDDCYMDAISGHEILYYARLVIRRAQKSIGGRVVMIDVKSSATGLLRFYQSEDFHFLSADEETCLSQLIYMLND